MSQRTFSVGIAVLLLAHATLLLAVAGVTPMTADERPILLAAQAIVLDGNWDLVASRYHGPLVYYASQLFAPITLATPDGPAEWCVSRSGMVLVCVATTALLAWLTWRAFGSTTSLFVTALHCTSPIVIGHGCLHAADLTLAGATILCVLALWRDRERPTAGRAACVGCALGVALATKYLAVLLVPVVVISLVAARYRRRRALCGGWPLVACALSAYFMFWTCYGFLPARFDLEQTPTLSGFMASLVEWPAVAFVLELLPSPFVRGVDQQFVDAASVRTFLLGEESVTGFCSYYAVALATKMPLLVLVLLPIGWLRRADWPSGLRPSVFLVLAIPFLVLSMWGARQVGVRYLMPMVPLLSMVAGVGLAAIWRSRTRLTGAMVVGVLVSLGIDVVRTWPNYLGAFNSVVGDQPYRWFRDTNLAWRAVCPNRQERESLRAEFPSVEILIGAAGPRFGVVALFALDLGYLDANSQRHWLCSFAPQDRVGDMFVFDVSEAAFREVAADGFRDDFDKTQIAIALAAAGRTVEALDLFVEPKLQSGESWNLVRALSDSSRPVERLVALQVVGRHDVVISEPESPPEFVAASHIARREFDAVLRLAEVRRIEPRPVPFTLAAMYAAAYAGKFDWVGALAILDASAPDSSEPAHSVYERLRAQLDASRRITEPSQRTLERLRKRFEIR